MLEQFLRSQLDVAQDRAEKAGAKSLAGMNRNGGDSSVLMPEKNVTATGSNDLETDSSEGLVRLPCPSAGEDESYGDLLDANEFERADFAAIIFQA
jgi:hypothetical protein